MVGRVLLGVFLTSKEKSLKSVLEAFRLVGSAVGEEDVEDRRWWWWCRGLGALGKGKGNVCWWSSWERKMLAVALLGGAWVERRPTPREHHSQAGAGACGAGSPSGPYHGCSLPCLEHVSLLRGEVCRVTGRVTTLVFGID